ncbi:hypothetical protein ACMFMG_004201 [Clarireedia jacksonii]
MAASRPQHHLVAPEITVNEESCHSQSPCSTITPPRTQSTEPILNSVEEAKLAEDITEGEDLSSSLAGYDGSKNPEREKPRRTHANVTYKIEYRTRAGELLFEKESNNSSLVETEKLEASSPATLEWITVFFHEKSTTSRDKLWTTENPPPAQRTQLKRLKINSRSIMAALRSVVKYYPDYNLMGDTALLEFPEYVLIHHWKDLEAYRQDLQDLHMSSNSQLCPRTQEAIEDLGVLLEFLQKNFGADVGAEKNRHARGLATFENLGLLFRPGEDMYTADPYQKGRFEPGVLQCLYPERTQYGIKSYNIKIWCLKYNGTEIGRHTSEIKILPFADEREITSLEAFPSEFKDDADYGSGKLSRRRQLEQRGKLFFELTRPRCMFYSGLTTTFPKARHEGLVMVDAETYYLEEEQDTLSLGRVDETFEDKHLNDNKCHCPACKMLKEKKDNTQRLPFSNYDDIIPETTDEMTPHQYFLCSYVMPAFVLKIREWRELSFLTSQLSCPPRLSLLELPTLIHMPVAEMLDIEGLKEPSFDTSAIEKLVMKEDRKELIKALAKSYVRKDSAGNETIKGTWSADFVQGKGEGQIFLLHGGPGVGKTCTAGKLKKQQCNTPINHFLECVADYTRRPLLSLTCSDIGVDPTTVEKNLIKYCKLAKQWGAILLIDEADIYMEKRGSQDLNRNSLVAGKSVRVAESKHNLMNGITGFLRAMEHYQGMIFLTTNRVGTFDDAFISRIHAALFYPDLTDDDRHKVWLTFISKLEKDRQGIMRVPIGTKEYLESNEVKKVKWNGRQIRNGRQMINTSERLLTCLAACSIPDRCGVG